MSRESGARPTRRNGRAAVRRSDRALGGLGSPRRRRRRVLLAQSAQIETGFAEVNGARLYYEISGEGHPVVLAHAAVSDHRMWDGQFALFAERYRVIRYDIRGFGHSLMPAGPYAFYRDLYGFLQALGIRRAHLIGVSASAEAVVE